MLEFIKNQLNKLNIDLVSCLSLDECEITRPYLLEKTGITNGSVILFAVPYLSQNSIGERNISAYAVSQDYHIFFKNLFDDVISDLNKLYPEYIFTGFSDHSPINEIHAAAKSGLGVIGKNRLLITEKYSSYVFIGEIITNAPLPSLATEVSYCIGCNKCISACPANADINSCLSAITQKKGELNDFEAKQIKKSKCAWGCDICQEVCPYTKKAILNGTIYSKIDYFNNNLTPLLKSEDIENMSDDQFSSRAYSWRGKQVISRNLKILEGKES